MTKSANDSKRTLSGLEIKACYTAADLPEDLDSRLTLPGEFPYTRGIHPTMYRGKRWTMRQYAGFGTAADANERYRYLLGQGTTGLSVAFDLPTQMGRDSDHAMAKGEVGRVGVAISSIRDMEVLLAGIPLADVSVSMTINATAGILLAFLLVVAEQQKVPWSKLNGTIQNDLLKEYIARGTYIYPPRAALRVVTDIFEFCSREVPLWNTISISGYHIREAGSTAVEEVAFTLGNGIAYVQAAIDKGLAVDDFAPRLAFFFNCHNNFLEEVAKFRAARRIWARIMRERFGAKSPKSCMLRFHTQTAGSSLTAQQPVNNVARTTLQALAAVFGGTQSLHTNSFDEAIGLPTVESATVALRTQQIIADESGVADIADPLAGSFVVERWTADIEEAVWTKLSQIDALGGMVAAIEQGVPQDAIERSAYEYQQGVENGGIVAVGVNRYESVGDPETRAQRIDPLGEAAQVERLAVLRAQRDTVAAKRAITELDHAARHGLNVMPCLVSCARASVTLGEMADVLRNVFGEYHP